MKKLLLTTLACLLLAGCAGIGDTDSETQTSENIRTEDISKGINKTKNTFSYEYDFDGDNENETIKIIGSDLDVEDLTEDEIEVTIGDYSQTFEAMDSFIESVYVCDIDLKDAVKDLAIITREASDDLRIRILNYDSKLTAYDFYADHANDSFDHHWLGNTCNYFNVNDDDTITLEQQTSSYGMWSVHKTYYRDNSGVFGEKEPKHYEILPNYMENHFAYKDDMLSGKEREMWEKGYIKAYTRIKNDEITIDKGDYFKVLYDNDDNEIFIENEDGESGWLELDMETGFKLNEYFFFLAG